MSNQKSQFFVEKGEYLFRYKNMFAFHITINYAHGTFEYSEVTDKYFTKVPDLTKKAIARWREQAIIYIANFSQDMILDKRHKNFYNSKYDVTL